MAQGGAGGGTSAGGSASGGSGGTGGTFDCATAPWMGLCCARSSCAVTPEWEPTAQIAEGFTLAQEALGALGPGEEIRFREVGFAAPSAAGVAADAVAPDAFTWWFEYARFHSDAPGATIVLIEIDAHEVSTYEDLGADVYHLSPEEVTASVKVTFHQAATTFGRDQTFAVSEGFLRRPLNPSSVSYTHLTLPTILRV